MESKKIKAVIDTNIFLYALTDEVETSCTALIDLVNSRKIDVVFAQDTYGELIYMMKHALRHHKTIRTRNDRLEVLHGYVDLFYDSLSYNTKNVVSPKIKDKLDEMFIKCAIISKVDYLISDDNNSGMHQLKGLKAKIATSDEFMDIYNGNDKKIVNE